MEGVAEVLGAVKAGDGDASIQVSWLEGGEVGLEVGSLRVSVVLLLAITVFPVSFAPSATVLPTTEEMGEPTVRCREQKVTLTSRPRRSVLGGRDE